GTGEAGRAAGPEARRAGRRGGSARAPARPARRPASRSRRRGARGGEGGGVGPAARGDLVVGWGGGQRRESLMWFISRRFVRRGVYAACAERFGAACA